MSIQRTKTVVWTPGHASPDGGVPSDPRPSDPIVPDAIQLVSEETPGRASVSQSGIALRGERDAAIPSPRRVSTSALPVSTLPMMKAPVIPAPAPRDDAPRPTKKPLVDAMKVNKAVVSSYKVMGFAVLATILLGLASFIFTNLFYMLNSSWVTPMVVSSTDPRVLQLNAQYAAEKAARDGVATQRLQLQAQLEDAKRVQASEEAFQTAFARTMEVEAADRGGELASLQKLLADLKATRADVAETSKEYTAVSKEGLKDEMAAGLIAKDEATRGGYELSQIAGANLALHEKHVELDARINELTRAVQSLKSGHGSTSYEILHMRHELDASVLASKKAEGEADAIGKSVAMIDATIADYDAQLARIRKAPYLQAADRSVSTAFVPYDNVDAVKVGEPVYSCAISVFGCKKIGTVAEVLDGEVVGKHPLHARELRGELVRLSLDDPSAIQKAVLHLRHAPFGI